MRKQRFIKRMAALLLVVCCMVSVAPAAGADGVKYTISLLGCGDIKSDRIAADLIPEYPDIIKEIGGYVTSRYFDEPVSDTHQWVYTYIGEKEVTSGSAFFSKLHPNIFYGVNPCVTEETDKNIALSFLGKDPVVAWVAAIAETLMAGTEIHFYYTMDDSVSAVTTRAVMAELIQNGGKGQTLEQNAEGAYILRGFEGSGSISFTELPDPIIDANGREVERWRFIFCEMLKRIGIEKDPETIY